MTMNTERDYLNSRVRDINRTKREDFANQFKLYESTDPRNYKEMIDWIKTGKYELDAKRIKLIDAAFEDNGFSFNCFDGIIWTGRGKVDRAGYEAAIDALNVQMTVAKDVINTMDAAAGLKALQDFESWTLNKKH